MAPPARAHARRHFGPMEYLGVGLVLLVLTTTTLLLSRLHLGRWAVPAALLIAALKALLIALVFMHLLERRGGTVLVLATSVLFVGLLVGLTVAETATRSRPAVAPGPFPPEPLPGTRPPPPWPGGVPAGEGAWADPDAVPR